MTTQTIASGWEIDGTTITSAGNVLSSVSSSGVTAVSNSDGSLTISPTTGSVVASLNLANANTWTGTQTFDTGSDNYSFVITSNNAIFENGNGLRFYSGNITTNYFNIDAGGAGGIYRWGYGTGTAAPTVFCSVSLSGVVSFLINPISVVGIKTTAGAATTLTVGASPYTYTNSSVSNQQIFIQGGTVSAISFNPNGGTGIALSAFTDNVITMRPNDTLTITYTAAPTVNTIQL